MIPCMRNDMFYITINAYNLPKAVRFWLKWWTKAKVESSL